MKGFHWDHLTDIFILGYFQGDTQLTDLLTISDFSHMQMTLAEEELLLRPQCIVENQPV